MEGDEVGPGRRRPAEDLREGVAVDPGRVGATARRSSIRPRPGLEPVPAGVVDQADRPAELGQAEVGVVVPEQEPVLGAAGEHPVGLVDPPGHEVVDQDADVGLRAVDDERVGSPGPSRAALIPAIEPLRGGLLVAGRAVDLAGEEEAGDGLGLEGRRGAGSAGRSRTRRRSRTA